jgi:hypothetical protein
MARRLNSTSTVEYDPRGKVVNYSDLGSGWRPLLKHTCDCTISTAEPHAVGLRKQLLSRRVLCF